MSRRLEKYFRIAVWIFLCGTLVFVAINLSLDFQRFQNSAPIPRTPELTSCINNLRQIDAAANQFALEHQLTNGTPISFPNDLTPYIKLNGAGKIPGCPQGGIYTLKKVSDVPTCSLGTTGTPAHVLP